MPLRAQSARVETKASNLQAYRTLRWSRTMRRWTI